MANRRSAKASGNRPRAKVLHLREHLEPTTRHLAWAKQVHALAADGGLLDTDSGKCHEVCERVRVVDPDGTVHYELVCRIVCTP